MARVPDTGSNAAPPSAPPANASPAGGLSGYYIRNPSGTIVFVQGSPPNAGGHWEQWYLNQDGTWTQSASEGNAYNAWGVWVPDGAAGSGGRDFATDLGIPGLPADVAAEVNRIFQQTPDVNQATALAMAYIRGTPWYQTTYPGIAAGINKGLFGDERGYRDYLNQLNVLYRQYYGRDVTAAEMAGFVAEGITPNIVGQRIQGDVIAQTNAPEWNYLSGAFDSGQLSGTEKQALGREQAGLDSPLGQAVARRIAQAQQRMQAVFGGLTGSPSFGIGGAGLQSPSLARRGSGASPDLPA